MIADLCFGGPIFNGHFSLYWPSFILSKTSLESEFVSNWKFSEILPVNVLGFQTHRDSVAIAFEEVDLKQQVKRYCGNLPSDYDWRKFMSNVDYRPFDQRVGYLNRTVTDRPRTELLQHVIHKSNLCFNTVRQTKLPEWRHSLVSRNPTPAVFIEIKDGSSVFPLYLYPDQSTLFDTSPWKLSDKGRRPNLAPAFVQELVDKLNLSFITDGRGDLQATFGPEDIFHYAYALFHSPTYRQRYAEFLKIDFPRLPLTTELALFRQLAQLGADLVALHLLEDDYPAASWIREGEDSPLARPGVDFVNGSNGSTVGTVSKSSAFQEGRVYLDTKTIKKDGSHFSGVPEDVWHFHIGGYQVCHKWLYDRRSKKQEPGRTLSKADIEHYQRMVAALRETIVLMAAVDRAIDNHGGWPLAGSQPDVESEDDEEEEIEMNFDDNREPDFTTDNLESLLDQQFGVEHEGEDAGDSREVQPFDPTLIRVDTRPLTIDLLIKRINNKEINLNPDFQRMGGIWNDIAQSRLIESLLIRIPLPAFYMDASNDDEWLVIDGLQRLTALKRFVIDQTLKLQNLEFWAEYNGMTFSDLPRPLQRRIEETQITLYLVQRGTPHNVKFNIFKRINTGGVPLSGQEIRHALNLGASTDLLIELAKTDEFLQATDSSVSPKRMTDRELVLRFLSFIIRDYTTYSRRDELDPFLNDRMQEINRMSPADIETLSKRFLRAMRVASDIFGNNAFRKQYHGVSRRSPISKALFEVWSVNFDRLDDGQLKRLTKRKKALNKKFLDLMEDPEFFNAITTSTGDPRRVNIRFSEIERIIQEVLDA